MKKLILITSLIASTIFVSCKKDVAIKPAEKQTISTPTQHTLEVKSYLVDIENHVKFPDSFKSNIYLCTNQDTVDISNPGQVGNEFRSVYSYSPSSFDSLVNIGFDTLANYVLRYPILIQPISSKTLKYTISTSSTTYLELHDKYSTVDRLILKIPLDVNGLAGTPIYNDTVTHAVYKPPFSNIYELFILK